MRIIPSICSTATGDFVFFATGEKDYSKLPAMRSRKAEGGRKRRLSCDEHFWLLISHGSHLDWWLTDAVAAPVALCAVQPLADTAFIASKNVGMDFPKGSHPLYSASFALVARAILDCGRGQMGNVIRLRPAVAGLPSPLGLRRDKTARPAFVRLRHGKQVGDW